VKSKTIEPYKDVVVTASLMPKLPTPGTVVSESKIPEIGVTEWRLSNGARVVLKPTKFQNDQIVLSGMSPGGSSLVADSMFLNATFASTAAGIGGLGELSQNDLRKVLTGKSAAAGSSIGTRSEGVSGSASRKDVETMFQLVHLRFTGIRRDSAAFAAFKQSNQAMLANRAVSPMAAYSDTITATMSQNHPRARPITAKTFDEISLDRSLAIYRDRFADASDFTFLIVGDFDIDSIKPHVQRYLASLPSIGRKEAGRDVGIRPPTGVIKKVVRAGTEPQSQTMISFTSPFQYNQNERYLLSSMGEILQNRLLEKLRESLGGTYSVSAVASGGREAPATAGATISFGSAPERAEELTKAVMSEIAALQSQGPSAAEVDKVREAQRRAHELAVKQNGFWLGNLGSAYQYGDDPRDILKQEDRLKLLTPEAIREIARKYLRMDNFVQVTLLPVPPKG
jgi:zinc protease